MMTSISWMVYLKIMAMLVAGYYCAIGWIYRKELLQWWKDRRKS